jgi:hypothetical protein
MTLAVRHRCGRECGSGRVSRIARAAGSMSFDEFSHGIGITEHHKGLFQRLQVFWADSTYRPYIPGRSQQRLRPHRRRSVGADSSAQYKMRPTPKPTSDAGRNPSHVSGRTLPTDAVDVTGRRRAQAPMMSRFIPHRSHQCLAFLRTSDQRPATSDQRPADFRPFRLTASRTSQRASRSSRAPQR